MWGVYNKGKFLSAEKKKFLSWKSFFGGIPLPTHLEFVKNYCTNTETFEFYFCYDNDLNGNKL